MARPIIQGVSFIVPPKHSNIIAQKVCTGQCMCSCHLSSSGKGLKRLAAQNDSELWTITGNKLKQLTGAYDRI